VETLRKHFPALHRGDGFVFFDNAAGAQIPRIALDAVTRHLLEHNVQRGGRYQKSVAVDRMIDRARTNVAALLNARRPEEIAFGMNATSFIRLVSLALGTTLGARDEIVLTDLDHEGNVATWLELERAGAKMRWWHTRPDGCLHVDDLRPLVGPRTRIVACTFASNALGSIVDVQGAAAIAHGAGAQIFVDGVHFGPHGPIDVQALDIDFLVCSGYKIFAPHMGFLWGRYELLSDLPTFREDFIADLPPGKLEVGTFVYENVAGMAAAIDYLAELGRIVAGKSGAAEASSMREDTRAAMRAIQTYERQLSLALMHTLRSIGAEIYGITDDRRVNERVPTVCFNLPRVAPADVSLAASNAGIGIRDGHMYAPRLMRRLGLSVASGAVRVSLVHYNEPGEIDHLAQVLRGLLPRP